LKIDPLDFRIKNGAREGTRRADGQVFPRVGMIETTEAAKKHPHYTAPLGPAPAKNGVKPFNPAAALSQPAIAHASGSLAAARRGRGVASGFWFNIGLKSTVTASVNADGTVSLVEGSTDIGGTRTS